ncbi:glycosyltransferase family 2 protein [Microlunatus flavus]|uniref:glycosyltransferase family 2 protein n=1 Tax=Microlunatus flavus TaxID=1036181 RepID=UPI0014818E34|nr:glycosyltransferase family 2 protein [Microlunatus flavus]
MDSTAGVPADVTVVIPTHNRRELLHRTLRSVLAQTDVDLTVLVVDDGSVEDVTPSVEALGDPRVTVLRHPQARGVSAARNTGIAHATTTWLAFVDDDDVWAPTKLRAQLDALGAVPDARWAVTGAVDIDLAGRISGWHLPLDVRDLAAPLLVRNHVPGGGSGVLAARDLVLAVGGFDEAISNLADWDFYTRLALASPVAASMHFHIGYLVHAQGMAHDVQRSETEYAYLDVKYGHERRRRGVALEQVDWRLYLANLAYNADRIATGIRLHAELVTRYRRWRSLRTIALGLAPKGVRHRRAAGWVSPAPSPDVEAEARAWLAPYAAGVPTPA